MATTEKQRPRLKNLDDLFNMAQKKVDGDKAPSSNLRTQADDRYQSVVDIDKLVPFAGHPFRLYEGERLDDMVESVCKHGVLVPIIAREKDDLFEILAGHNRVNASRIAGQVTIPAILLQNVSEEEALIIVVETNLMQRSFADMTHSEKAAVISMQHTKLFSQGKRNDIIQALRVLENPNKIKGLETCTQVGAHSDYGKSEHAEFDTSAQVGAKFRTDQKVGDMYSLSKNTVARYLRIHKLEPALKTMLDDGVITFIPAVTLSFLKEHEQQKLARCIELNRFPVDMKKADILRQYSEGGELDDEQIYLILNGELGQKPKPNRTPVVKVNRAVYARYFQPGQSAREVQEIVEKALERYFRQ